MSFNFPNSPVIDQVYGEYYWDGEKWSVTTAAGLDSLLLETGSGLPYLVDTVGLTPATVNMLPWGKDATYTDFSWVDGNVNGHPGGYAKDGVTIGTLVAAPDGTTTGQHLTENSAAGNHRVWAFFGPQMATRPSVSFRAAAIVKAATRTRVVLAMEVNGYETIVGASVGFDLAGGNFNYDTVAGSSTVVTARAMTDLGGGWWLCQFDFHYTGTYSSVAFNFNWNPKLYIDAGAGTAARNISYTGNGTSGIYAWWINMLPTAAWALTSEVFRDDFDSLSTIDLTNSLAPGFNWYLNNNAPNSLNTTWWSTLPVTDPASLTISSPSVLQIYNPNSSAPQWNSVINSVGLPVAGGYVGHDWQAPMLLDGMFQWDNITLHYGDFGFLGPAFWGGTREILDNTQNPSKYWMEWDVTDIGATSGAVFDHWLDAANAPHGGGNSWVPSVSMSPSDWHRVSGLWLNMAANNYGQGIFLHFFDGSFTQYSDVVYNACDAPQPPGSLTLGWNSQAEWQHMTMILNTGNNVNVTPGGGWPMRIDFVRTVLHPSPPKIYNYWNIYDQLGTITVAANGLQLTKTTGGTVWAPIRASIGKNSGKWYWELTLVGTVATASSLIIGIMSYEAAVSSDQYPGGSSKGAGAMHSQNWNGLVNGVTGAFSGTVAFASGDVFGFAFDANAGKMYVHRNGTWINGAPGGAGVWTGLSSATKWYPAASIHDASLVTISANFGSAAFVYTIPSGYLGMAAN